MKIATRRLQFHFSVTGKNTQHKARNANKREKGNRQMTHACYANVRRA